MPTWVVADLRELCNEQQAGLKRMQVQNLNADAGAGSEADARTEAEAFAGLRADARMCDSGLNVAGGCAGGAGAVSEADAGAGSEADAEIRSDVLRGKAACPH